ncbi:MAG: alcohol dehydrogenase catalytic domain-containing protein [Armatimonadota bacterium]|nr:alcohol dehydrogenase catalytic domain-containing protein [Armatimonadota bacterium]MCX7778438.1 alcohol dehydrogenase catalytic domain-containing protein [Armatimonadota bacterium]MDW8026356.1 alcohol dehydrogenase catalytic domain-containing protein [Armatimonadota bacterium]
MKAAFFRLPGEVELREVSTPEPKAGEALVRIIACGICGTDAEAFRSHKADWHRRGHEYAGEVVAIGEGVVGLKVGDIVSGVSSVPCGKCNACLKGLPKYCAQRQYGGSDAFAEYVCKRAEFFHPIHNLTPEEGALIEPLTVALQLVRDGNVQLGSTVLLIGAGPIGLMALKLCRECGASKIFVSHPSTSVERLKLAQEWGADLILHPDKEDVVGKLKQVEPDGVECVLVTIKPSIAISQAVEASAIGGTIAFVGVEWQPEATLKFDVDKFHFHKLKLIGSDHNPCSLLYDEAEDLLQRKVIDAQKLITHRFPLDCIGEAFDLACKGGRYARKVMVGAY